MQEARTYGWKRDTPDHRDFKFSVESQPTIVLPESVDLRSAMPSVYDQKNLGSCTANAICAAIQYDQAKNKNKYQFPPSRLFLYYQERLIEGTVQDDAGAMIRDGIKACANVGICPEYRWPYDVDQFTINPDQAAYESASQHKIQIYHSVNQSLIDIQTALAQGFPVVFGFTVYESFECPDVARTGILNMPARHESMVGGHAVLIVGYDNATKRFIVRNSWGEHFGLAGYFTMPYAYVLNSQLASDFWLISTTN